MLHDSVCKTSAKSANLGAEGTPLLTPGRGLLCQKKKVLEKSNFSYIIKPVLDNFEESDPGKKGVQELVAGLATTIGIDPTMLVFKWDQARLILQEHGLALDEPVFNLSVFLGKRSVVLAFSKELTRISVNNAEAFVSAYAEYVMTGLRKLKRPEKK